MNTGFNSLYGYTNGEQGIRHAMLEAGAPAVDETDAFTITMLIEELVDERHND